MIGVLLINLGTPDDPSPKAVRRYLRQFLMDPYVVDMHPFFRWLLVYLILVPFRSPKSAALYQKIWERDGSPLQAHTHALAEAVGQQLNEEYFVVYAMRYGNPLITEGLKALFDRRVDEIVLFPLYPQYAVATTESTLKAVGQELKKMQWHPRVRVIDAFYKDNHFLDAWVHQGKSILDQFHPDHILFSFHGLPERQIKKCDLTSQHCLVKENCCESVGTHNHYCYRAHCFETARLMAGRFHLNENQSSVSFQSRLGFIPWIKPYTDLTLQNLAQKGIKRLAVFCPSFVADCLETLEEIGIRGRELFLNCGGEAFELIPSLNHSPAWIAAVCHLIVKD